MRREGKRLCVAYGVIISNTVDSVKSELNSELYTSHPASRSTAGAIRREIDSLQSAARKHASARACPPHRPITSIIADRSRVLPSHLAQCGSALRAAQCCRPPTPRPAGCRRLLLSLAAVVRASGLPFAAGRNGVDAVRLAAGCTLCRWYARCCLPGCCADKGNERPASVVLTGRGRCG